jgi:hypothetical protein
LVVGEEGSSPERRHHGDAVEAEGLAGARLEEQWVAPVVKLESTEASWQSSWMCRRHKTAAGASYLRGGPQRRHRGETTSVVLHSGRWHQRMGWGGRRSKWGSRGGAGEGLEEANTGGVLTGLGVVTVGPWRRCWFWTRRQGLDLGCEGDGLCGAVAQHSGAAVTTSQRWAGAER